MEHNILALLEEHPSLKAKDIARLLNVSRKNVNRCLYGKLHRNVWQDNAHGWHLTNQPKSCDTDKKNKSKIENLTLLELLSLYCPSKRLTNCLARSAHEGSLPFSTVGEYVNAGSNAELELMKIRSIGKKAVKELSGLVQRALQEGLPKYDDEFYAVTPSDIEKLLGKILSNRQLEVLFRRMGINQIKAQTLEEVGKYFGVTRERIRQIEKQALLRCRATVNRKEFNAYLNFAHNEIMETVVGEKPLILPDRIKDTELLLSRISKFLPLCMQIAWLGLEGWLNENLKPIVYEQATIGWIRDSLEKETEDDLINWTQHHFVQGGSWKTRLMSAAYQMDWPISIDKLSEKLPDLSKDEIVKYLTKERRAVIKDGYVVQMKKLASTPRMIYILRDAGRALHTSQVRARHLKMFDFDMAEHAIGAILQRLKEALIVERGKYDLYENLPLDASTIMEIRDKIYLFVKTKGEYVSAKVIYNKIVSGDESRYNVHLTDYMILGIAQDDSRFSVKRGLMIGLIDSNFQKKFISLKKSIYNIVQDSGPVSVTEITEDLSPQRKVLKVTVGMMLRELPDIVAIEQGKYNLVSRVIGDKARVLRIRNAIEICLLDGPQSVFRITERFNFLGFGLNKFTIYSFCQKLPQLMISDRLISLERESNEIKKYDAVFHRIFDNVVSLKQNRYNIISALDDNHKTIVSDDYRLTEGNTHGFTAGNNESDETEILDDLLEEFDC